MKKLAKTYNTPECLVPNLIRFKKVDAMFYHIMNYYKDNNTSKYLNKNNGYVTKYL
jgi:hypothetical protein